MGIKEYREFIANRATKVKSEGFTPDRYNQWLKVHQKNVIDFALNKGRSAAFLDTGLGKSLIELEFANQCSEYTGKPSLILTPLAVAGQMVREGQKFGIDARQIREQHEVGAGVMVANYERLAKLDPSCFGAVILDESSILKSFAGRIRTMMIDAFGDTPFKLAATATPSPNDHMELGNHAEFLGVMRQQEMLSKWFINDTSTASQEWRLKGHARDDFWQWVASWSRCATMPSDLGGDDTGYALPDVIRELHVVEADTSQDTQGLLFRIPELSATSFHDEKRKTLQDRCEKAASIVFSDICAKLAEITKEYEECHGNLNTKKIEKDGKKKIQNTRLDATSHQEPQKKTQNTCENTTKATLKNSNERESSRIKLTQLDVRDTQQILNTQKTSDNMSGDETQVRGETKDCDQHTEFHNLTMMECLKVRDFVAKFVEQSTKKKEEKDFTSIIVTQTDTSGDCSALRVTRLLEKCVMMLTDSEAQYDTLKKILLEPVLIFVDTNEEQKRLEDIFGNSAFSVKGSDIPDKKEKDILDWCAGVKPWLISKSSIVGFGMNFQHCCKVIFASINFSYEKYYQAVRRVWRFGQENIVNCHIVISDTEMQIWNVINEKAAKHGEMKTAMADAMKKAQSDTKRMVAYDRPLDLWFPEWLKTGA